MGALYKNYKSGDIKNADPGYSTNAFLTPISYFTDIKSPVVSDPALPGESVTIGVSHVYDLGKGSIAIYCPPKTIEGDGDMVGEDLARSIQWKPKIIIVGDGPQVLEMVLNLLKESFLLHVEDAKKCQNGGGFIQFGSKCTPCIVAAGSFKSGTTGTGRKQYEFELEAFDKYFYNGAITEQA